jgi:hypothetical protein
MGNWLFGPIWNSQNTTIGVKMKLKVKENENKIITVERKRVNGYNVISITIKKEQKTRIIQT